MGEYLFFSFVITQTIDSKFLTTRLFISLREATAFHLPIVACPHGFSMSSWILNKMTQYVTYTVQHTYLYCTHSILYCTVLFLCLMKEMLLFYFICDYRLNPPIEPHCTGVWFLLISTELHFILSKKLHYDLIRFEFTSRNQQPTTVFLFAFRSDCRFPTGRCTRERL